MKGLAGAQTQKQERTWHGRGSKRDSRAWEGEARGRGHKGVGGDGEPVELREGKVTQGLVIQIRN